MATALDTTLIQLYTGGVNMPTTSQDGYVAIARVTNAKVNFDYLASDDVHFGDMGVPVGRYLAANSNNLREAIRAALAANPTKILFLLPPGVWDMTQLTESLGLRNNLVFDGIDPLRCTLQRASGQIFLWQNVGATNIVFRNITFSLTAPGPFSASINMDTASNVLIDNCRFLCNLSGLVADGTYHGVQLLGGSNLNVRNCYAENSQFALSGLGRSVNGARFINNTLIGGNDCGVSCCTSSTHTLKNVQINGNRFIDLNGSNFIYVGDDDPTTPPEEMSDVEICDNVCSGSILTPFGPTVRMGIQVAWCDSNKRIKVSRNTVSNDNPEVDATIVRGIAWLLRSGSMSAAWDCQCNENSLDFTGLDDYFGLTVNGAGVEGMQIIGNIINEGGRGLEVAGCSNVDVAHNIVRNSTTQGMVLDSGANALTDVRIRHNYIRTTATFKSSILVTGDNNISRCDIEHNTLRSGTASVINSLTGGATFGFDYNYNSHENGLHASAVPDQNINNQTE
jgi:hypothetical protein